MPLALYCQTQTLSINRSYNIKETQTLLIITKPDY